MQDQHLFEYAVIRIVPQMEREEFINTGVILFCKKQRFLRCALLLNEQKLLHFAPQLDVAETRIYLEAFQNIAHAGKDSGPIGKLDVASRFRWLTAVRSTVVQTSRIHPGFCHNLEETVEKLLQQYAG